MYIQTDWQAKYIYFIGLVTTYDEEYIAVVFYLNKEKML